MRAGAYVLALALAAPLALLAQEPARRAENPAQRLLAHRAELALTAEQVKKLEAMDRQLGAADQAVVAKLEGLRPKPVGEPLRMRDMSAADRAKLQENRAELQPLMKQLRTSHQQAITDIRALLTPEQARKADAFLFEGPGRGQGAGAGEAMGQGRGQGQGRAVMNGRGAGAGRGRGMMMHRPAQGGRPGRGG